MGKIYKALEKSKKERDQLQKDPFRPYKNQMGNRRQPTDMLDKGRSRSDSQPTPESKLGSIHTLLDDSVKLETAERDTKSSKEKVQDPAKLKPVRKNPTPETSDEINKEREIDVRLSVQKKNEPPRPLKKEPGDKRRPTDMFDKDIAGLDFQPTPISKLNTIQALLDESAKIEAIESCTKPSKEKGQAAEKVRSGKKDPTPVISDEIKQEREIGLKFRENKKNEPLPTQKQEKGYRST